MPVILRAAHPADGAYILRLEETCMRAYAEALWGCWRASGTPEAFDVTGHFLIVRNGLAIGCLAETWHADHLFVDRLYIDAPFQRQGIGAHVLRARIDDASIKGFPVRLSVLTTNPAIAFYRREGFTAETETPERIRMLRTIHRHS